MMTTFLGNGIMMVGQLVIGRERGEREHSGKLSLYTINSPHCQGKEAASYSIPGVRGLIFKPPKQGYVTGT